MWRSVKWSEEDLIGVERRDEEWSGVKWSGVRLSGVEWSGVEWRLKSVRHEGGWIPIIMGFACYLRSNT
jgi:hypothetical protein